MHFITHLKRRRGEEDKFLIFLKKNIDEKGSYDSLKVAFTGENGLDDALDEGEYLL